jgi:ABC-type multidrug transport system fused ATPase/permease subunit
MLASLKKLISLLDARERRRATLVLLVMMGTALSEAAGVASVMPFIAVLSNPDVVVSNRWLAWAFEAGGFTSRRDFLVSLGAGFFLLLLLSLGLKALGSWAQLRFSFNRSASWGSRLVAAYLRQPYDWFLNHSSAALATSILSEVDAVITGALIPVMRAVAQALVAVVLLGLLVIVDPLLAACTGIVMGGSLASVAAYFRQQLRLASEQRYTATQTRFKIIQETFGGIKEVKLRGLERVALSRFNIPSEERVRWQIWANLVEQIPPLAMQAILFGGMLAILTYLVATRGTLQDALPVVALYALAGYRLMPATQALLEGSTRLRVSEVAIENLARDFHTLLYEQPTTDSAAPSTGESRLGMRSSMVLHGIHYTYPEAERPALCDVTVTVKACQSIGIVGSSGSGKSTLVDVALGLLHPQRGYVEVDGERLRDTQMRTWQRSLGYVPQQIYLADDTIAANIAFGLNPTRIDMAAVERAARVASLHEYITKDLPEGYATRVGERGVRLSGGQRQRIGIARAMYHDPDVLFLDEATSALDNLTEQAVMDAMRILHQRKTVVMIAHRLSTVRHCDCIYMLDRGQVVAQGTYGELLEGSEQFRKLALST